MGYEWNESYSVGVDSLDLQHKTILSLIKELDENSNALTVSDIIMTVLPGIRKYGQEHFDYEEQIVKKYAPDQLEEQQKQHHYYNRKINEFASGMANKSENAAIDLYMFLGTWWLKHILKWDMRYKGKVPKEA